MPDKLTDNLANNSPILANKLSDGEIKKALELFKKKCDENIELQMICDKQKAEIEKLNKIILKGDFSSITALRAREHWFRQNTEHINRLNAEIERLKEELNSVKYAFRGFEEEIKAEAYKEVAERLNKEFSQCQREYRNVLNSDGACAMIIAKKVTNNLLKELVGEDNSTNIDKQN